MGGAGAIYVPANKMQANVTGWKKACNSLMCLGPGEAVAAAAGPIDAIAELAVTICNGWARVKAAVDPAVSGGIAVAR
jgi:hypothetical protein